MTMIINDIHIGARRQAGTTPYSQEALRTFIFEEFEGLLQLAQDETIVILGDLFDAFTVDSRDLIETYQLLTDALRNENSLVLVMGNHDYSAKNTAVSSFHLLAHFLMTGSNKVRLISHEHGLSHVGGTINNPVYAIPHCLNQDLFDIEINKAIALEENRAGGRTILLHCNIKNNHCADSEHSLNLNDDQLGKLTMAGWKIVCAHEHQMRTLRGGRVVIPGNQAATSVSDCLNCDGKYFVRIGDEIELIKWRDIDEVFGIVDWQDEVVVPNKFIRVTGKATAEQASDVVNVIASMRKNSDAYVLSNAVCIEGIADFAAMTEASFEDIKGVDVLGLLLEEFDAKEQKVIKELLA